jgi:hypothetical protein
LFCKFGLGLILSNILGAAQAVQTTAAGKNQIATLGGSGVVDADIG